MSWGQQSEFLSMGGYGFFVWTSWGVGAVLMIGLLIQKHRRRAIRRTKSRPSNNSAPAAAAERQTPNEAKRQRLLIVITGLVVYRGG